MVQGPGACGSGSGSGGGSGGGGPLAITTTSLPNAMIGTAYSQTLTASGGSGSYTWSVNGAGPPAAFSLSANGTLSGTAACGQPSLYAQGTWGIQVQVTDSSGQTAQATIPVTVVTNC